jgi:hypothetical protein
MDDLKKYTNVVMNKVTSKIQLKEFVVAKICQRFNVPFKQHMMDENPLITFIKLKKNYDLDNNISHNNPITKYKPQSKFIKFSYNTFAADCIQDCIWYDYHFLSKIVNQPCIIVDVNDVSQQEHTVVLLALVDILKNDKKRPMVLNISSSDLSILSSECYVFNTEAKIVKLLPHIASHCILISNKRYPIINGIARESCNNIYYLRSWCEDEIENNIQILDSHNFDRFVTNMPLKPPSGLSADTKIYRILDWFDIPYPSSQSKTTQKVLIGSKSSQSKHIETLDASKQITTYVPLLKQSIFDVVIDDYGDIPLKDLYNFLVYGANVQCKHQMLSKSKLLNVLFSKDMFIKMWKDHLSFSCPSKNPTHAQNNTLLFNEFLLTYIQKHGSSIPDTLCDKTEKNNTVFLIDNRNNPFSVISLYTALSNVEHNKWRFKVYTSKQSDSYYKRHVGHFADVEVLDALNTRNFDIDVYNDILKDTNFWKNVGGEKALVIQDDGLVLRKGVEKFLQYDYVGAPWVDNQNNAHIKDHISSDLVGNGGLSLRDVKKCQLITAKYEQEKYDLFMNNYVAMPEDIYFVMCMNKEKYKIAPSRIAIDFSCEQVINNYSVGMHKAWCYHRKEIVDSLFTAIVGVKI